MRVAVLSLVVVAWALVPLAAQDRTPGAVAVSRQLADAEGLAVGDRVRLSPDADEQRAQEFVVVGVFEPVPDPARLGAVPREVRLHLPALLALSGADSPRTINVALHSPDEAERFARDLNARLPGVTAEPAVGAAGTTGLFRVLERFHFAIAIVTILAATAFLLALTVMLVDERRETVGVLRLVGVRTHRILAQLLIEGLVVAGAGAAIGLGVAWLSEGFLNRFFQWRYDTALEFVRITPTVAATSVLIAVPLGAVSTVVTAWALLRRNALRLVRR